MDKIEKDLLKQIADIEKTPMGAYNIRENGKLAARNTTANIDIVTKTGFICIYKTKELIWIWKRYNLYNRKNELK